MKKLKAIPVVLSLCITILYLTYYDKDAKMTAVMAESRPAEEHGNLFAGINGAIYQMISDAKLSPASPQSKLKTKEIYTFLQGPRAWAEKIAYAGAWNEFEINGNKFGAFGCGLCCMASIYNTLSTNEVSPLDMYENAIAASNYRPDGKVGAIGWRDMQKTLKKSGVSNKLMKKPKSFKEFKEQIIAAETAVVLVNSYNDDTIWKDTPGHYVNIWMYQEDTGRVFLGDPGNPEKNRTWVSLKNIYKALKTSSTFQYLIVDSYNAKQDKWNQDGISEKWIKPL
jgi:hypothetical protein